MLRRSNLLVLGLLMMCSQPAWAMDAKAVKAGTDKLGVWLVKQYDSKEKSYGSGAQGKDPYTLALIVEALANSPREYREGHGPFISEPVKIVLAKLAEDKKSDAAKVFLATASRALVAVDREKYKAIISELPGGDSGYVVGSEYKATPAFTAMDLGLKYSMVRRGSMPAGTQWAQDLAERLLAMQQADGSLGADLQVNALGLDLLTACYNVLK